MLKLDVSTVIQEDKPVPGFWGQVRLDKHNAEFLWHINLVLYCCSYVEPE